MEDPELKHSLEAVKLMSDWSKWLITLVTALIGALAFLVRDTGVHAKDSWLRWPIIAALAMFVLSSACATFLLYKLPAVAQELPRSKTGTDVYHLGGRQDGRGWTTGALMWWQQGLFLAGLLLFVCSLAVVAWRG